MVRKKQGFGTWNQPVTAGVYLTQSTRQRFPATGQAITDIAIERVPSISAIVACQLLNNYCNSIKHSRDCARLLGVQSQVTEYTITVYRNLVDILLPVDPVQRCSTACVVSGYHPVRWPNRTFPWAFPRKKMPPEGPTAGARRRE